MRRLLAAILLATVAVTASGAAYWVHPVGSNLKQGPYDGRDSTLAHALSVAWFNDNAAPGDTCLLSWGSYSTPIWPRNPGTNAARITYLGPVLSRHRVIVPSVFLDSLGGRLGDYITVSSLTVAGEVKMSKGFYHARWDSIVNCSVQGGTTITGGYTFFRSCSLGTGDVGDRLVLAYDGDVWANLKGAKRNQFTDCTVNLLTNADVSTNFEVRSRDSLYMARCRFTMGHDASAGNGHLMTFYGMTNSTVEDCSFRGRTLYSSNVYMPSTRDEFHHNFFTRDTIEEIPGGVGKVQIGLMTDGSAVPGEYNGYNTYTDMRVRVRHFIEYQADCGNDSHFGGVYICGGGGTGWGLSDSITIRHCTLMTFGAPYWPADNTSKADHVTVAQNLFYTTFHHTSVLDNGDLQYLTNTPGVVDSNMFYAAYPSDSTFAINGGGGGGDHRGVGPWSTWCTSDGNDCASYWLDPMLSGASSWETVSPIPDSLSKAYDPALWADGYVGAINAYSDTQEPTVSLTGPCPYTSDPLPATGPVTLCWTSSDNKAVTEVRLFYSKGTQPTTTYSIATGLAASGTMVWAMPYINEHLVNVFARAYDAAGNSKTTVVVLRKGCPSEHCDDDPDRYHEPSEIEP